MRADSIPDDFTPDLRRLKSWPSMKHSPWRQPYLADLTYGEIQRLVDEFVPGQGLKILDVGCGRGYLSLELAREGHDVLGIDSDQKMIRQAKKTMDTDPYKSERGPLNYLVQDFTGWKDPDYKFDLVIFGRALHHIPKPGRALGKAHRLLRIGGRIICIEYAYDRFDHRSATWFYHVRKVLEQPGWYKTTRKPPKDASSSVKQILEEWMAPARKEHFNRSEEMLRPLRRLFQERHFSWEPYIYWDMIMDMRVPSPNAELALARSLIAMEGALIDSGAISPVLFCFVGDKTRTKITSVSD